MNKRVLVVDDDRVFRSVAEEFLKGMGYSVKTAKDGEEAVELAFAEPPDIMILDIVMPGMNGLQVCKKIKKEEKTKDTAVIIVSGDINEIEKGFDYGADDCISKPLDWDELAQRIKEI